MLRSLAAAARAMYQFRGYEPQPVTAARVWHWVRQFQLRHRAPLLRLLSKVRYISKREAIGALTRLNAEILRRLDEDGVDISQVIYVSLDSAGSSSGVMLNLLRDHANLERRGARFIHSQDGFGLSELTKTLERGALIYVDDFAGSGKQFVRSRRNAAKFVVGSFSEYLLVVCACEESVARASVEGIEVSAHIVHRKSDRPLRAESHLLNAADRESLRELCASMHPQAGLGFDKLSTSVVLFRNSPNTTPLVLRGNLGQKPIRGVLPRFDDLPT